MAYELRAPQFDLSGSLASAIDTAATAITGKGSLFTGLRTDLSTGLYIPLTIADDGLGKSEIVWATSHASASPTIGVIRGREGTTPLPFDAGAIVRCAPTIRDAEGLWASRAALPADPHVGMRASLIDEIITVERTLGGWDDSAPIRSDTTRKHVWAQTGAVLNAADNILLAGLPSGNGGGGIASQSAGNLTLNKPGLWTLGYATNTDNTVDGYMNAYMLWAGGAFLINPYQTVPRHVSVAGSGLIRTWLTWTGYVSAAQAAQPIKVYAGQNNTNGGQLNGCAYYLSAEYLGG